MEPVTAAAAAATATILSPVTMPSLPSALRAEHMPAHLRYFESKFTNTRGQNLSYLALFPNKENSTSLRGIVVFLHGIAEHCRRYFHLYAQLCEHGFGVVAYDLLSHGESDFCPHKMRAHARKFQYFVDDTNEFVALAKQEILPKMLPDSQEYPPLILAGMSYGTLVSLHTILSQKHDFKAVVMVAPAVSVEWTTVLRIQSVFSKPLSLLFPRARIVPGVNRDWICRDPEYEKDFRADPLTITENVTVRMGEQSLEAMRALQHDKRVEDPSSAFCQLPMLFLMGSEDRVTSLPLAKAFFDRIANKDKEFKVFDGLYHCLFDDPEREQVFTHLMEWLQRRFSLPKQRQKQQEMDEPTKSETRSELITIPSEKIVEVMEIETKIHVSKAAEPAEKATFTSSETSG